MTDKQVLINKLGYKAQMIWNCISAISALQHDIARISCTVMDITDDAIVGNVDAIDDGYTITAILNAVNNARTLIKKIDDFKRVPGRTIDKQDLLWRTKAKINLLDTVANDIQTIQCKVIDMSDDVPENLQDQIGVIEESDDIADIQIAVLKAEQILRKER